MSDSELPANYVEQNYGPAPISEEELKRLFAELASLRHQIDTLRKDKEQLSSAIAVAIEVLETLSRLGNAPHLGNSDGNVIAQKALKLIDDIMKEGRPNE